MAYGAISPLDYPSDVISIRCERCDRFGRYRREAILERFGADIGMPDVLAKIAVCEHRARVSAEGCRAVFVELSASFRTG